jgi:hypothetical protein
MADLLPPTPVGVPPGHSFWNDWYERLRTLVNTGTVSVLWNSINFAGSNITNIANRAHNNLQSVQGGTAGEYYHLTLTQQTRVAGFISAAVDPTTADIAAGQWALYKNTTSGLVKLWTNDGGTLKSVTLT